MNNYADYVENTMEMLLKNITDYHNQIQRYFIEIPNLTMETVLENIKNNSEKEQIKKNILVGIFNNFGRFGSRNSPPSLVQHKENIANEISKIINDHKKDAQMLYNDSFNKMYQLLRTSGCFMEVELKSIEIPLARNNGEVER